MLDTDDTIGLRDRMESAVGGLHAPDVMSQVLAAGHRHRSQRRIKYAAGGVAAVAAAGAIGYPLTQGTPRESGDPGRAPGYATDPSSSEQVSPSAPATDENGCPVRPDGWWNMPGDQIPTTLAGLLPEGVTIGWSEDTSAGAWSGNLVETGDRDFVGVSLLPPPRQGNAPEPREVGGSITLCGTWEPWQNVRPCARGEACEEIRDDAGALVGVVREKTESTIENGVEVPTDKSYFLATLVGPGGGHVEIYAAEGTRDDRPDTVHDPADQPPFTMDEVVGLVTNPVWTSYDG